MKNSLTTNDKTSGYDVPIHAASGGSDLRNLMSHLWHMVDFPRFNDSVTPEPKIEVAENKSNVTVTAEIPGVAEKDIDLQISSDGYLTISAEKAVEETQEAEKKGQCVRRERWSGALSRAFYVGEGVTEEDVKAKYENGVLSISIPKKEAIEAKAKKMIAIE